MRAMRLFMLVGLCIALGFALGFFMNEPQSTSTDSEPTTNIIDTQAGLGTDMSLLLSASGVLCEAVRERPRTDEIDLIGNMARQRQDVSRTRLLTQLQLTEERRSAVDGVVNELNEELRTRVSGLIGQKAGGAELSRLEAIDFVMGNLDVIRSAEEGLRAQLTEQQISDMGAEVVNPFAYLDEDVVQLFLSMSATSTVP